MAASSLIRAVPSALTVKDSTGVGLSGRMTVLSVVLPSVLVLLRVLGATSARLLRQLTLRQRCFAKL